MLTRSIFFRFVAILLFAVACYKLTGVGVAGTTWGDGNALFSLIGFLLFFALAILCSAFAGSAKLGEVLFSVLGVLTLIAFGQSIFRNTDWGSPIEVNAYSADPAMQAILISLSTGSLASVCLLRREGISSRKSHIVAMVGWIASTLLGCAIQFLDLGSNSSSWPRPPLNDFKNWLWLSSDQGIFQDGRQLWNWFCLTLVLVAFFVIPMFRKRIWAWSWLLAPFLHRLFLVLAWPSFQTRYDAVMQSRGY